MAELTLDREYHAKGIQLLCGVDEAGRGPLAGPVFAAAVILPADKEIPGLRGHEAGLLGAGRGRFQEALGKEEGSPL